MDQVGNICRCDCHITFLGEPPEWKCYCSCGTGKKQPSITVEWSDYRYLLKEIGILQERIDKLEGYMQMEDRITASDVLLRLKELEHHICIIDENREAMY